MKTVHAMLSFAFCFLLTAGFAVAQEAATKGAPGALTIDLTHAKLRTGDLDVMIERRTIRVLTTQSKTFFFNDKGVQRGIVVDYFRLLEEELNKKLAAEGKLKNKNLKVRVMFIPVRRDQLLSGLTTGKGDIAAANLTVTPERQKLVDFSAAGLSNVSEVVVTGPASPKVATVDDLAGSFCSQVVELPREHPCAEQESSLPKRRRPST